MTEEILGEALAAGAVVGGDGLFAAVVDVEAGVFPSEEVGEVFRADELGFAQGVKEAVAEGVAEGIGIDSFSGNPSCRAPTPEAEKVHLLLLDQPGFTLPAQPPPETRGPVVDAFDYAGVRHVL